jgi:hypothetical protein
LEIIKPALVIAVDNSSSISHLQADSAARKIVHNNAAIQDKYAVQAYRFDSSSKPLDKIDFKGEQTNLDAVAKDIRVINKNSSFPTLLVTDGNQTTGNDYVYSLIAVTQFSYSSWRYNQSIRFKINQLNVNKYAFYKNKFP